MAICTKCGSQIEDTAAFCPVCGNAMNAQQNQYQQPTYQQPTYQAPQYQQPNYQQPYYQQPYPYGQNPEDTGSIGWGVLGYFIPLVGLILFLTWKDTKPKSSKVAGKGALIGVIVNNVVLPIIIYIIAFAIAGASYY